MFRNHPNHQHTRPNGSKPKFDSDFTCDIEKQFARTFQFRETVGRAFGSILPDPIGQTQTRPSSPGNLTWRFRFRGSLQEGSLFGGSQ